jgi:hypothetical protein
VTRLVLILALSACSEQPSAPDGSDVALPDQQVEPPGECLVDADCVGKIAIAPCEMVVCNVELVRCEISMAPQGAACNDGDPCTIDESCQGVTCEGGQERSCDDSNPCTDDACVDQGACEHSFNEGSCDDGNNCTENDLCASGICAGSVSQLCFIGSCCETQNHPGCGDADVRACVCAIDDTCCQEVWNAACVDLVNKADCGLCEVSTCGDLVCDDDESCDTCPADCGECVVCGDGVCDPAESCSSCEEDCGECPIPECGDLMCDEEESCAQCPQDCGECPAICGDGTCQLDEDCTDCPSDCGECPPGCGDGVCTIDESCEECAADCGACVGDCCLEQQGPGCTADLVKECVCLQDPFCCEEKWDGVCVAQVETTGCASCDVVKCGDGLCDPAVEACDSCPQDCGECPMCGDNTCDGNENCESCPGDCGECAPACCETSPAAGCAADPGIEACVCAQDFFCCAFSWDSLCVNEVELYGCGSCP